MDIVKKTLRLYQHECFRHLFRCLTNGHREVILSGPTGCGKSLMVTYLIERLLEIPQYISAVVIAPQMQIQDGFFHRNAEGKKVNLQIEAEQGQGASHVSILGDRLVDHTRWVVSTGKRMDHFRSHVRASKIHPHVLVTTHQAVSRWFGEDPTILPQNLTGRILVIDEAHHASSKNQVGNFAKAWKDNGGTIIHLTATPFRTDDDILLDKDAPRWTLTLGTHIGTGFAPSQVKIRSHPIPMVARTVNELSGTDMGLVSNLTASVTAISDLVKTDGDPKSVIIVPPRNADEWATALQKVLETRGLRVFNAVKGGDARTKELSVVLSAERRAASKHFNQSQYDVILACARFNEGTDWPFCSHVYNIGLTYSFLLILQRLGRGMRPKFEIEGYPEPHKDLVRFTFLVPSVSDAVFTEFEQKHQDHAFMTACFMADVDTGQGYLSDVARRLSDSRPRRGKYRPSDETWEDVIQFLHADVQECRKAAGHMVRAISAMQDEGKPQPTDEQVTTFLTNRMGLKGDDLDRVVRALQYNRMKRKALAFQGFKNRLLHKLRHVQDYKGDPRIIREDLQPIFDEMKAEFADEVADIDLTASVKNYMSQFSGRTTKAVAHSMRMRFGVPQPTDAEIENAIRVYVGKDGKLPPDLADDASEHFGYAPGLITWQDVNNLLARRES